MSGRQRKVHALIFTACYSRHMFVWLSFTQTLAAFLAGSEAALAFFGGCSGWCRKMFRGTFSGFCARPRYVAGQAAGAARR